MAVTILKQNVGIDISKNDFKVCFYQWLSDQRKRINGTRRFNNTLSGFKSFLEWTNKKRDQDCNVCITLEATGVYYEQLVHFLHDKSDFHISVVLPNMSKSYFKSLNLKSKTDKIDAKALGLMGLERNLAQWQPFSDNMRLIKQLTRERLRLLDDKIANMNRLEALKYSFEPNPKTVKRLKSNIKLLDQQIKQTEKEIHQQIHTDQDLKQRIENICEIKGLGVISVITIIAETDGFKLFTSRGQLICYAGYDIVLKESGTSVKGKTRISKKGNQFIRRTLYFPAIVAVKYDQRMAQLFKRVFDRTAIKMKAYVAVQRKLLLLIFALFCKNEKYDPNYLNYGVEKNLSESL